MNLWHTSAPAILVF